MTKGYQDKRWTGDPGMVTSRCGDCAFWEGFGKCIKFGTIPGELIEKSFPGTEKYQKDYCQFRQSR
jgi:hypothetical protein